MSYSDRDRLRILLEDGVVNNNMDDFNQQIVQVDEIINRYPKDVSWSHTLINSPSNCVTLIAQLKGEGNREHYHPKWDEWWYILQGKWIWSIEGKDKEVKAGDIVFIERNKKHKITGNDPEQLSIRIAVSRADVDHVYD